MTTKFLEEYVVPGKRLGRHVHHDPRSLAYPFKSNTALKSVKHTSSIATLDQGSLGSCTGNATVTALGYDPFYATLPKGTVLDEALAVKVYSKATALDSYNGTYPPTDTGSDGLDAAKAAQGFGLISGYTHALSLNDALAALVGTPVIIGIDWYEGFDTPSSAGLVSISGSVRGGHEVALDQIDVENSLVWFHNSWGEWGVDGRACMSFTTLGKLLSSDGDCTVFTPLTAPAPTPVPTPTPTPVPTPGDGFDAALVAAGNKWEKSIISELTQAGKLKAAFNAWKVARGY